MPKRYDYVTVDVFTDHAFAGNPLAVVTDATGLHAEQMQAIAAEFNYSESTFVLPPEDSAHTARVRIFTRQNEIPFAGHPNVGTAFTLARLAERSGKALGPTVLFEEAAGLVPVDLMRDPAGRVVGAILTAPQPLSLDRSIPAAVVAECVGLDAAAVLTSRHEPVVASVGLPFLLTEVTPEAIRAARSDARASRAPLPVQDRPVLHPRLCAHAGPGRRRRPAGAHVLAAGRHRRGSRYRQRQRRADRAAGEPRPGRGHGPRPRRPAGRGDGPPEPFEGERREEGRRGDACPGRRALRPGDGRDADRLTAT